MSSKRFKWHGSTISLLTGYSDDSPSQLITGITQADPPVVTSNNHGLVDGDVVRITGVLGMTELNGGVYVVDNKTTHTFELFGVNATAYGAYTSGGEIEEGEFSNFCELTGYNRSGAASAEIDATTICSEAKEYEVDLPDFGTTELSYNFAPRTAIQEALAAADISKSVIAVRIVLPNSGGEMVQLGFVQTTSEQAANGGKWEATANIRNTGRRYDVEAA